MNRRDILRALGVITLTSLACFADMDTAGAAQKADKEAYTHCAKACSDCMKACQACAKHCSAMVAAGMKQHEKSKRLSEDCGDICATAAKICTRRGPMTAAICAACAQACDACGAECGKYPTMQPMKDCAQSCKVCAAACREMLKALKG